MASKLIGSLDAAYHYGSLGKLPSEYLSRPLSRSSIVPDAYRDWVFLLTGGVDGISTTSPGKVTVEVGRL